MSSTTPIQIQPLVSICIPSYNHEAFLPDAIESVLNQSYPNCELVIVDDGSTDGSLAIAERYAREYPTKVQVFTHPEHANRGVSATVNLGFRKSRGAFWSGLPSDDMIPPDKIELQVDFLRAHPEVGWVYGLANLVDTAGTTSTGSMGLNIFEDPDPIARLISGNAIPGMTVLARRECVEAVGSHDEALVYSDWEFWIRMAVSSKGAFIAVPLAKYRVHGRNLSISQNRVEGTRHQIAAMRSLLSKLGSLGGALAVPGQRKRYEKLIRGKLCQLYLDVGVLEWDIGNRPAARQALSSAMEWGSLASPRNLVRAAHLIGKLYVPPLGKAIEYGKRGIRSVDRRRRLELFRPQ